jgi:LuxR family transcriptional regulator
MTNSVLDILDKSVAAETIDELWQSWLSAMNQYGFSRVMYGLTRFASDLISGDPKDFFILTNFTPEYVSGYFETKLFLDAPMLRWALENSGAKSWAHIAELNKAGFLNDAEKRVIAYNQTFGIIAGYTISFQTHALHGRAAVSLSSGPGTNQEFVDNVWKRDGCDVQLINQVAHLKVLSLPHSTFSAQRLTPRQREVLQWVSDGKSTQDIAILMDVSKATVEKHLRLARDVLGVETTAQAVLRLAYQNQIFKINE